MLKKKIKEVKKKNLLRKFFKWNALGFINYGLFGSINLLHFLGYYKTSEFMGWLLVGWFSITAFKTLDYSMKIWLGGLND